MPQSQRSVSTRGPAAPAKSTATAATGHGRSSTASNSVHSADNKHRKSHAAPAKLTGQLEKAAINQGSLTSSTWADRRRFDAKVNDNGVTSRAASPISSISSNITLLSSSDASSNTFIDAPNPSAAARRHKFKEEFGSGSHTVTHINAEFKPTKPVDATVQSTSRITAETTVTVSSAENAVSASEKKQAKNRSRKKPGRSCSTEFDFTYRNTYTAATGNAVSAHFGCVVM